MCPNCRAFITTSDKVCPYCNEVVAARAIDVRDPKALLGGLIPASKFTTSLILLLNIGVFIASTYGGYGGQLLFRLGDKDSAAILFQHEWWRLITAGFLHGGIFHIGYEHVGAERSGRGSGAHVRHRPLPGLLLRRHGFRLFC